MKTKYYKHNGYKFAVKEDKVTEVYELATNNLIYPQTFAAPGTSVFLYLIGILGIISSVFLFTVNISASVAGFIGSITLLAIAKILEIANEIKQKLNMLPNPINEIIADFEIKYKNNE